MWNSAWAALVRTGTEAPARFFRHWRPPDQVSGSGPCTLTPPCTRLQEQCTGCWFCPPVGPVGFQNKGLVGSLLDESSAWPALPGVGMGVTVSDTNLYSSEELSNSGETELADTEAHSTGHSARFWRQKLGPPCFSEAAPGLLCSVLLPGCGCAWPHCPWSPGELLYRDFSHAGSELACYLVMANHTRSCTRSCPETSVCDSVGGLLPLTAS